jgi:membrane-associated PAP2 superfamily phosphatase
MKITNQIIITGVVLIFAVVFFAKTNIDIEVQNYFFDYSSGHWMLDSNLQPYKFIFYDGVKKFLILFGLSFLIALIFFRKKETIQKYKRGILIVILSAILVPVIVGAFKKYTNMPCPKNEIHYGGVYPRTAVWESYPPEFKQAKIQCWPAGHASGGFALLSLVFLFRKKRNRAMAFILAMSVGWSMGLYKMMVGDHFLSHTIITMILAWLIVLTLAKLVNSKARG